MSRIGKSPVPLPEGVTVELSGNIIKVHGPKGELSRSLPSAMQIVIENSTLQVQRPSDSKEHKSLHGLTRSLVANMVIGVSEGFTRVLELYGMGFRITPQGQRLGLQIGFSHPTNFDLPEGIAAVVDAISPTNENQYLAARITLTGIDKEELGLTAARLRALKKPEPYKGKGFRYQGEFVRRKPGKAAQAR